jgi:hypothetical protein
MKKSELIKALQTETRRHDLGTFVDGPQRKFTDISCFTSDRLSAGTHNAP